MDESAAKTNMTRLYGRSLGGRRCVDQAPHGHWNTTSMISSIRSDGSTACMILPGAADAAVFRVYAKEVLCPTLKPGDIVIADNLAAHKDAQFRLNIQAMGASLVFLPPYSPDLNPIENLWSKIKQFLRCAKARTEQSLEHAVAQALELVSASDAKAWFQHCGYAAN